MWFRLLTKVKGNTGSKVAEAVTRQFDQEEIRNRVVCEENLGDKGELSFFKMANIEAYLNTGGTGPV